MSEFTDSTHTVIIESLDGDPVDMDAVKAALAGVVKVRGYKGGDHLIAQAAITRMLDSAKAAAGFVGVDPQPVRTWVEAVVEERGTVDHRGVCEECEDPGCTLEDPMCMVMEMHGTLMKIPR